VPVFISIVEAFGKEIVPTFAMPPLMTSAVAAIDEIVPEFSFHKRGFVSIVTVPLPAVIVPLLKRVKKPAKEDLFCRVIVGLFPRGTVVPAVTSKDKNPKVFGFLLIATWLNA
jgi:hypothetical protein